MEKKEKEKKVRTWTIEDELEYIAGMGTHGEAGFASLKGPKEWLASYIKVHEDSPHENHIAAVAHCRKRLEAWDTHV